MSTHYTVCGICEQACGLKVTREGDEITRIEPDKENGYSWRDFCIKGAKAHLSLNHPQRIKMPMKRVGDRYVETTYEEAISDIAGQFSKIVREHGPNAIATYTGNPNGFNFSSALFQTLFLDALGTDNRYWVGSVDQNALHVVSEALYGNPWVSLQTDIDHCDHFLLIGTNPAVSTMCWIGYSPDGWKRVLKRQANGAKLVVVDPRETESASRADQHIAPLPESDWAMLLAMIKIILDRGQPGIPMRSTYLGIGAIQNVAQEADLSQLAQCCDIPLETIRQLAIEFADAPRALAVARTGVSQGRNGVLALWLTQVLNVITGRMEAEGGVYYSNGVLDLLVAGDRLFPASDARSRIRGQLNIAGSHSLAELSDEITTPGKGQIRALIINSGNPVVSGPDGDALDNALSSLDCLVAIDHFQRESHRHADWLIPGDHFLERSEINLLLQALSPTPRAQSSRAVVELPPGMRFEWEFFRDLSLAMNLPLLGGKRWLNPLVRFGTFLADKTGFRQFGLSPANLTRLLLLQSDRFRWKEIQQASHGLGQFDDRPEFGAIFGKLAGNHGRINMAPEQFLSSLSDLLSSPKSANAEFPLQLIGRRRLNKMNSWSTETSALPSAKREDPGNEIEICPEDAQDLEIRDGDTVDVVSVTGRLSARVKLTTRLRRGVAVMEHGWGSRTFDPSTGEVLFQSGVNRNRLVSNSDVDPLSRVPRLNGTPVRLER